MQQPAEQATMTFADRSFAMAQTIVTKRVAVLALALISAATATAQDRRPLREAKSKNDRFELRIEPGKPGRSRVVGQVDPGAPRTAARKCEATLVQRGRGDGATGESDRRDGERWKENLVNDVSPARAFIHDDGKYVVTVDEYRFGGTKHAVVVYDEHGKLKREFGIRDLLKRSDWRHVRPRGKAVEWLPGAKFAFADAPDRFKIDLKWGRKLEIDLEKGEVIGSGADDDKTAESQDGGEAGIPPELLALFDGSAGEGGQAAFVEFDLDAIRALLARAAAGETLTPEELAQLAAALPHADFDLPKPDTEQIAAVLEKAMNEGRFEMPAELEKQLVEQALNSPEFAENLGKSIIESESFKQGIAEAIVNSDGFKEALAKQAGETPAVDAAGNSATAGWAVPMPNPAKPIDYVAWLNDEVRVEGGAAPAYREALDGIVKWEGGEELMDAANKGDPEALASPELAAWLEANAGVMQRVMNANELEFRGMEMNSPDGSMMGILLPHISEMRQVGRMMTMKGRMLEQSGDANAAMEYYLQSTKLGAQASNGPTLIENLVGQAVQNHSSETLLDSLAKDSGGVDYTSLSQRMESEYRPTRPVAETFQMERTFILDMLQQSYEYDAEANSYRVSENGVKKLSEALGMVGENASEIDQAALGVYLGAAGFENLVKRANDHYDQITEAVMSPFAESRERFGEIERAIDTPTFRVTDPVLSRLLPAVSRAAELSARSEAQRRATLLATSLKAHKQQTGSYPDSLDSLGERDFLVDPFSGQRFAYRRSGEDFTLYSVGSNMSDEGGVHDPKKATNDIVYWPRPPKQ